MIPGLKLDYSLSERFGVGARVMRLMADGQVSQGQNVEEVERRVTELTHTRYAVGVSSGSDGLEMVFRELKERNPKRNTVIMPTNTFVATPLAAIRAGLKVILVDMEPDYFGMDLAAARSRITDETLAVVAVNIGGIVNPKLMTFAQDLDLTYGIPLIEDSAHSLGSIPGLSGMVGVSSFFSTKVFTGGEGGVVFTNDQELADKYRMIRNFGKRDQWVTYHEIEGFNYRMNELAACMIAEELKRAEDILHERRQIALKYATLLGLNKIVGMVEGNNVHVARYNFYKVIYRASKLSNYAAAIMGENDIQLQGGVYDSPVHLQPLFRDKKWGRFPVADTLLPHHICLPIYRGMADKDIEKVVKVIKENEL